MHLFLSALAIILCLVLVIGVHEAGHAIAARFFGVKCSRISIGFGRVLFRVHKRNGCEWVWSMWPLGGYVELLNSRIKPVPLKNHPYCFDKKPVWVRCVILLAGALANICLAYLALMLVLMIGSRESLPIVQSVHVPSIVADAGLLAGDRITHFAGVPVHSWQDVGMRLVMVFGKDGVPLVVENEAGISRQTQLNLHQWHYKRQDHSLLEAIGLHPDRSKKAIHYLPGVSFGEAVTQAATQVCEQMVFFAVMLKQLLTGAIPFLLLLGPFGMFMEMVHSFFQGFVFFLSFIASLSLSVALINLLPIPALDGGSIIYAIVEKIRGKPLSVAMEVLLYRLVFIVFCMLLVQLLLNDLQRYVSGI